MSSKQSPWIKRFDGLLNRHVVRERAEIKPEPVEGMAKMPAHLAAAALEAGLGRVMVLNDVELDIIMKFIQRSHAYSVGAYPDLTTYIGRLHAHEIDLLSPAPVCLTGVAGVGKSALLSALVRALPEDVWVDFKSPVVGGRVMSRSSAMIRVDGKSSFMELLQPWLPSEAPSGASRALRDGPRHAVGVSGLPETVRRATRFSYRSGMCASLIDEMQFMTQSATANARVTQFLLLMTYLKVPLIYCANYSLCHKLLKRNQEDRDRLLSAPLVLPPLSLDEDGLGQLLQAYDVVLAEVLEGESLCQFMDEYASMTLGIKRKVRQLTLESYNYMRERGDKKLTAQHFRAAYSQRLSTSFVRDVNDLKQQSIEGKPARGRSDLWCPFGVEFNRIDLASEKDQFSAAACVSQALMRDSLTRSERAALDDLKDTAGGRLPSVRSGKKKAEVVQLAPARKGAISAADLLSNTISNRDDKLA